MKKCQLCGKQDKLTKEHLPQRSLYPKSIRSKIVPFNTLLACAQCNNGSSDSDELTKVIIGLIASSPWTDEIYKSVGSTLSNNKRLDRLVDENTRYEMNGKSGENIGIFKIPEEYKSEFIFSIERIVKGLFFKEFKQVLISEFDISLFLLDKIHPSLKVEILDGMKGRELMSVNANSIEYMFVKLQGSNLVCFIQLFKSFNFFFVLNKKILA
ncbi:hypothetical protein [Marinicellulosiphila megalodicopiae]|uniref:hypothetical protein n=1 Tax=Marinicellulosiphila megalodicopiae TaxID=2724896 RepID=UPI003BB1AAAB